MMKLAFSAASLLMCAASVAMAGDGRPTAWAYMDTGIDAYGGIAQLSTTSDRMWPILMPQSGRYIAYALNKPLGKIPSFNAYQSGTWKPDPVYSELTYNLRGVMLGPNGQMAIQSGWNAPYWRLIDSTGHEAFMSRKYSNGPYEYYEQTQIHPTNPVAFNSNGDFYWLNSPTQVCYSRYSDRGVIGYISTSTPIDIRQVSSMAISPTGLIGFANQRYYQTLDVQGNVTTVTLPAQYANTYNSDAQLIFDAEGQPHIVDGTNYGISVSAGNFQSLDYNSETGSWNLKNWSNINYGLFGGVRVSPRGVVGISMASSNTITYSRYDTDKNSWEDFVLPNAYSVGSGLTFQYDCNDSPVICYLGKNGNFWIAYDPNSIPEPTSVATFAFLLFGTYHVLARQMRDPA